jgi:sec-independent protein translocase protein TatC
MAIATALPYIAYEIYMFIAPGLYAHEKKFLKSFIISFSILFVAGGIYGYYLIMPITFKILIIFTQMMGAGKLYTIDDFYNFVFLGILANAFFFTMPVFIVLAVKFNVISVDTLTKNKRYIYVIVMVITAIITPDPTPVSMLLLSIPFIALYELSIFFAKRVTPI